MMKKLLCAFAALAGMAMPVAAQSEDGDTMYVVKDGKVVGQYAVGKDADYITFKRPAAPQVENMISYGSRKIDLKACYAMQMDGYTYVFITPEETIANDYQTIMMTPAEFTMIMVPDECLGKEIDITNYDASVDDAPIFQAYYVMGGEEYQILAGTSCYDLDEDLYSGGKLKVDYAGGKVSVDLTLDGIDANDNLRLTYEGTPSADASDDNTFVVDDSKKLVRAAFYKDNGDTYDFYLTSGAIDHASELENAMYYAHLQVPLSLLDGSKVSLDGTATYRFNFVDNANEKTYDFSTGNANGATGTFSVHMLTDNTYEVEINISDLGDGRSFSSKYNGEFSVYDLSKPNAFRLQNQDDVAINSAVTTHSGSTTTIYLSSKEGVTTTAGMADAEIVITVPDEFLTGEPKGFSGTETNAQISITYDGVTYNQANCGNGDDAKAIGGTVSVSFSGKNMSLDFMVYNIYKYNEANLSGHYEGKISIGK